MAKQIIIQRSVGTTFSRMTSFLPYSKNKTTLRQCSVTTLVVDELSRFINFITSFFAKRWLQLDNEVLGMLAFILATEVVLLKELGENEGLLFRNNKQF